MVNPCKGCTERKVGCHSQCDKYITWKEDWDRCMNAEKARRDLDRRLRFSNSDRYERRK